MQAAFKIFKIMKSIIIYFLLLTLLSGNLFSQVIPVGTITKTNKLVTLNLEEINNWQESGWPYFGFKAIIQHHGSKSPIIETGFVAKEGYYETLPNLQNATKFTSGFGNTYSFEGAMGGFPQPSSMGGADYSVRAFAKNSFGQVSYSNEVIIYISYNFCANNPCNNSGGCYNGPFGAICQCTINFCGNCCAEPADPVYCPGGGEFSCNVLYSPGPSAYSNQTIKNKYFNHIIRVKNENAILNNYSFNKISL